VRRYIGSSSHLFSAAASSLIVTVSCTTLFTYRLCHSVPFSFQN
jgi:hypothetical protein